MTTLLKVSPTLKLPIDAVTQKMALLGMSGSGKTNAIRVLIEEMLDAHAQVVYLDPKGEGWALRLKADGKTPAYPIPVFGGQHGDVPLRPDMGTRVADLIVGNDYSAILDLSDFIDSEMARFGYDFATRLLHLKKKSRSAMCLLIDECQDFVPQNPQPVVRGRENYEPRMLHAFQRLQKQGRATGVGMVLAGQRPQEISKKVLNLCECYLMFRLGGLQERSTTVKLIGERDKEAANALDTLLPTLDTGHAYVWSAFWLKVSSVHYIREAHTFDSSATPEVGAKRVEARKISPVDLEALNEAMADVVEQAKASDPAEWKRKLREVEAQSAYWQKKAEGLQKQLEARPEEDWEAIRSEWLREYDSLAKSVRGVHENFGEVLARHIEAFSRHISGPMRRAAIPKNPAELPRVNVPPPPPAISGLTPGGSCRLPPADFGGSRLDAPLPVGERVILIAAAQHPGGVTREQCSILTGYKRSSRDAYIQRLRTKELVVVDEDGLIKATTAGVEALGQDYQPLPTGDELRAYWLQRLPEGERAVLKVVVQSYPHSISREAIDERTGYKRSSRDAYIQRLRTRKLVQQDGSRVKASDHLFD